MENITVQTSFGVSLAVRVYNASPGLGGGLKLLLLHGWMDVRVVPRARNPKAGARHTTRAPFFNSHL